MLKKFTLKEQRINVLRGFLSAIKSWNYSHHEIIHWYIHAEQMEGEFFSNSITELTCEHYGSPSDGYDDVDFGFSQNCDEEFILAKVLTCYFLIINSMDSMEYTIYHVVNLNLPLLKNIRTKLPNLFPEYIFKFNINKWPEYTPKAEKTIIDNISNTDVLIANPIKELLMPFKSQIEISGLISNVNAKLEQINVKNDLRNLNATDLSIAKNAKKICGLTINNVNSAKGHKGKSELTIKDIAHNFALNASLFFKLVELNDEKSKQLPQDSPIIQKKIKDCKNTLIKEK